MSNRERVLIFGCGYHGRAVYRMLDRKIYDIVGFIDNGDFSKMSPADGAYPHYPGAIDGKFDDTNIYHSKNVKHIDFDKVIISGRFMDDMIRQLKDDFIIDRNKILVMERSDLALNGSALAKKEKTLCELVLH